MLLPTESVYLVMWRGLWSICSSILGSVITMNLYAFFNIQLSSLNTTIYLRYCLFSLACVSGEIFLNKRKVSRYWGLLFLSWIQFQCSACLVLYKYHATYIKIDLKNNFTSWMMIPPAVLLLLFRTVFNLALFFLFT